MNTFGCRCVHAIPLASMYFSYHLVPSEMRVGAVPLAKDTLMHDVTDARLRARPG